MIVLVSSGLPRPVDRLLCGLSACALVGFAVPSAHAAGGFHRDETPLPKDVSGVGNAHAVSITSSTGSAAIHMVIGLVVVLGLIFAIYAVLKRTKGPKGPAKIVDDGFISVVSSTPLGPSRSLHLVKTGNDLVLLGASEQSITPIRVYTSDEARRLGVELEADASLRPEPQRPSFLESLRNMTTR
jgi:flagellar biosynthetic protein FliO